MEFRANNGHVSDRHLGGAVHRGANVQLSQPTIDRARRTMGPPDTVHLPMAIRAHPYWGNHFTVLSSLRSLHALCRADCQSTSSITFSQPGSPCKSNSEVGEGRSYFLCLLGRLLCTWHCVSEKRERRFEVSPPNRRRRGQEI